MSVFFAPVNKKSIEQQALAKGPLEEPTLLQKVFGTGGAQKTMGKILLDEKQKEREAMEKLKRSWHVEDLKQVRKLAREEEEDYEGSHAQVYYDKAEKLREQENPQAGHYERVATKREETAEETFRRSKHEQEERMSKSRHEQEIEIKRNTRLAIRQRLGAFKSSVRGETPPRPVTPSRAA
jgi:hypothetical protein